jgi:4'-phosphopantetheinyl transferase
VDTVHISVGRVPELAETAQGQGLAWLSAAEQMRLARIVAAGRRSQFLAGRWFARQLLATVYGGKPGGWQLSAPDDGPALVEDAPGPNRPHISLSHSGEYLACAAAASALGLDLEAPRRVRDFLGLADVICCTAEVARLRAAQPRACEALFYECWTLKEAWLKSRAEDLSPGRLAQISTEHAGSGTPANGRTWRGEGFTLALVAAPVSVHWIGNVPGDCRWWWISDAAMAEPSRDR